MKRILALAAVAAPLAIAAAPSQAAPAGALAGDATVTSSSIERVASPRCRRWRRECARRWPALGGRFRRCLVNHGCARW